MSPLLAIIVVAVLVAGTVAAGMLWTQAEGRRRAASVQDAGLQLDSVDIAPAQLGAHATLVQFSTEFCSRCPQTRRVLTEWAQRREGVRHTEVDLTHRPDLAVRYGVLSTPTTLLVDAGGVIRSRFSGVPRPEALAEALADVPTPSPSPIQERR